MTDDDRKTLKWPADVFNPHNQKRQDLELEWPVYASRLEYVPPDAERSTGVDTDELAREIVDKLDGNVSEEDLARAVASFLDYDHLAELTAERTAKRLRG